MKHFRLAAYSALLLFFMMPFPARGQTIVTGGLAGTITDPSGAGVASAGVSLKNNATGETSSTTTSNMGYYKVPLLKPGVYALTVTKDGFKTQTRTVTIEVGQDSTVNMGLELGSGTTTVEVSSEAAMLQTENANITTTFNTHIVDNIPNPGNDITYNAQFAPGVTMNTSSNQGYGNFSTFGLPGTSNLFTINGNDYNDPFLNLNNSGASNLLLGNNDVQEVSVVNNGYTGQYGRQAGSQIDVTTKSGSNAIHGSANYWYTGSDLNAEDTFLKASGQPKPRQNNNQWAADIGGPIKKDKAFFYLDTEGIRYIFATATPVSLPTPAFQSFVLSQIPSSATSFYQQAFNLYNNTKGIAGATPVPNSCVSGSGATATTLPVAGGQCIEQFTGTGAGGNQEWLLIGRVDYNFSDNDKIFARVKFDRGLQPTYTDPINPAFDAISHQPQDEGQLNYTHIFSPTVVNNFIFSDLWYSAIFQSANLAQGISTFPEILCPTVGTNTLSCLGPTGGEYGVGFLFPQGRNVEQWQLVDDLSITRGNHNFKMGVNFRRDDVSDYRASELTNPPAIFSTLGGFASDSVDVSTSQNFAQSSPQPLAMYSFGLYFQDEYRVSPKFMLTLTLRADRNSGGVCQSNCTSLPPFPFNQISHDPSAPFNQLVQPGQHNIIPNIETAVFQPRIGFAWTPMGSNTVFRGGVGLFTDLYPGTILDNFTTNFPEVNSFSVPGGTINPGAGSGATLVQGCNTAFTSAFNSGANAAGYAAAAPACAAALPPLYDVNNKLLNPKVIEWNFEIEHTFTPNTIGSIDYVGNHGYNILLTDPYLNGFGFGSLPAAALDNRVSGVQQLTNGGYSNYNGITASIRQNVFHGLSMSFNYTYSHALDNVSNGGVLPFSLSNSIESQIDPINPNASYGSSDYDVRHQFNAVYVWTLPFKTSHRWMDGAIGGWQVSGDFFYRTGFPFSIVDTNQAFSIAGNNLAFNGAPLATILAQPVGSLPRTFGGSCANAACFSSANFAPSTDFIGPGRNFFRGPGYFNTDLSLQKTFKITERVDFVLGANGFNILNHVNYQNPIASNANPFFGKITAGVSPPTTPYGSFAAAAEDMRIIQVLGKLRF